MARNLPELRIEEIGGNDFVVASQSILKLDNGDQLSINVGSVGVEKRATRRKLVEHE